MTDHLPECPWPDKPCGPSHEPMHDRQPLFCVACLTECNCERIKRVEKRVVAMRKDSGELWLDGYGTGFQAGHTYALDAAREAVAALIPRDYELNWCAALDAIDALKEKP